MLNESRTCFMILGSFQIALFLVCYRRPLAGTHATDSPSDACELMPSNTYSCPRAPFRTVGLWSYYAQWCFKPRDRQKRMAGLSDKNAARPILECPEPQQQRVCLAPKAQHSALVRHRTDSPWRTWGRALGFVEPPKTTSALKARFTSVWD
jgi:hypothetical protein